MLQDPSSKYKAPRTPRLLDRTWPNRTLGKAPRWLSTDLRDGNQALASPLTIEQKSELFKILVQIGFKEIEIGFPASSETDFEFTQRCVNNAPDDVWLQVMTPCSKDMIRRTIDSVTGANMVIVSLYIATSDQFIGTVFDTTREKVLHKAVEHATYLRSITKDDPYQKATTWNLMWSPEAFSDTDPNYAIEVCKAVHKAWNPSTQIPMVLNLPATVEISTPNVYADLVEIFCRGFLGDETICVSLHPHNDRGCAVAAAELGQLAGATRVEGCLFGNGERTGNVDLVTLALNFYTQGVDPKLDFSKLPEIRKSLERLTQIAVHTRAPYAGDSVFLAYSGGHQDAIQKAMRKRAQEPKNGLWNVPYLPIDPCDIGSTYEAVIRVNSQSGRGGMGWVLERELGRRITKEKLRQFSSVVKLESEKKGRFLEPNEMKVLFLEHEDMA